MKTALLALLVALLTVPVACGQQEPSSKSAATTPITAAEFSRIVQEFSEPGGYFRSDNFTSNETSYLHITGKLKELGVSGGAYIGVGPEQNFTYIAKIRPRIAFIVDIRRQAVIQHLMYKAIFHQAENRAQFLSWLFSKPLPGGGKEKDFSLEELLQYMSQAPSSREVYLANLAAVRKSIVDDFHFPLSPDDVKSLDYVYTAFWRGNLRIGFSFSSGMYDSGPWGFPTLKDLILATDHNGQRGNFLAAEDDYQFVRKLQEQNRIIPVVGDFGGTKALATVAGYLKKNGYTVSAFYTSNVEQFLFENKIFGNFAESVSKMPIDNRSVFIRAVRAGMAPHPAYQPGDRMTPLLEKISDFVEDYRQGRAEDYWSMVTKHYIAGTQPREQLAPRSMP